MLTGWLPNIFRLRVNMHSMKHCKYTSTVHPGLICKSWVLRLIFLQGRVYKNKRYTKKEISEILLYPIGLCIFSPSVSCSFIFQVQHWLSFPSFFLFFSGFSMTPRSLILAAVKLFCGFNEFSNSSSSLNSKSCSRPCQPPEKQGKDLHCVYAVYEEK